MEIDSLERLIPVLAANKVSYFQSGELRVKFFLPRELVQEAPKEELEKTLNSLVREEISSAPLAPPDVQASIVDEAPKLDDELMQYDDVLYFSSGGNPGGGNPGFPLPLTGEEIPSGAALL